MCLIFPAWRALVDRTSTATVFSCVFCAKPHDEYLAQDGGLHPLITPATINVRTGVLTTESENDPRHLEISQKISPTQQGNFLEVRPLARAGGIVLIIEPTRIKIYRRLWCMTHAR